ncbi:ribbon-helix-helix domain-containing protein [uncultured Paracoccus sp.]|uniref:ribbon-helix-helix domain-containing protein n=1 Tax=uncultured Paracoccus sp. TaxID=189685 RepID=UPI00261A4D68|nr:ribbon-helix-helix domain-containing protein [uncultured Paracoccus sp.]
MTADPGGAGVSLPPLTRPVKRSVTLDGHPTSVSLEDAFWTALQDESRRRGMTPAQLISTIDHARPPEVGLATALRLFVLAQAQLAPVRPPD